MSRLKELRLHGFKSFADPTRFVFEPGVNAVIGPNGSGKSNMADAVRWVLGEQSNRYLRTRRAEDVIFAGSQARRPQGMAEAILTLDNADGGLPIDFGEVSIGRRAYRSGESEYLINGARARLRDIVELLGEGQLGANALVVVGQGTVDSALSLRPEERRQLFEDAAGVKSLQVRKNEALGRLARARDNLTRIADLVGELKPQVRRLALQAQHQQEHATFGRRARALVVELHRRRESERRSALGEARRAAAAAEAALEAHRVEQAASREAVGRAESAYWESEAAARRAGERRAGTREALVRAEGRAESLAARLAELVNALESGERAVAEARSALAGLDDPDAMEEEIAPAIGASRAAEAAWQEAITALAAADATLLEAEEELSRARGAQADELAATARLAERQAALDERRSRVAAELAEAESAATAAHQAVDVARAAESTAADALGTARAQVATAEERVAKAARDAEVATQQAEQLEQRIRMAESELATLADRAAQGDRLAPALMAAGWRGLVDHLDPPREVWAALEAVLGGELVDALLWDGDDPSSAADATAGVARLLALGSADPAERDAALRAVGGTQPLTDLLGTSDLPLALARVVIAPSLGHLLEGWRDLPAGWVAVTETGDVADGRGVVSVRGRRDPHADAAARQHARSRALTDELATLRPQAEAARAAATAAAAEHGRGITKRDEAAEALRAAEEAHRTAAATLATTTAAATRTADERERLRRIHEETTAETASRPPMESATPAGQDLAGLADAAVEARAARDAAASRRDAARDAWQAARAAAQEAEARSAGRRGERAILEGRLAALEATVPGQRATREGLEAQVTVAMSAVEEARSADVAAAEAQRAADAAREARRRDLMELERGTGGAAAQVAELERVAQATAIAASRAEDALAAANRERALALEGIPDEPAPDGEEAGAGDMAALDDAALEAELRRVRRTLGQIGSVNPFAVEEHRELSERLDGLTAQQTDLGGAIAATDELIATLDVEITERFNTAFAQIATRFDEFCQLLFAGGSASLQLSDGEDGEAPGGIEIVVRPPGKRLQRLAMLSGGERALAGVALLFAMLSVNPVPFCILDEVDAALDEANIGRFADALRKLSESIDFVVITHNRATIEVADTIYGVTMTDAAVSSVLSLRLADVPAEVSA